MQLYLFRHGKAEPARPGETDADRVLSEEGERVVRRLAVILAWMDLGIERILTSPYRRAQQTAELLAQRLNVPVDVVHEMAPGATLEPLARLIHAYRPRGALLAVGHQPDLGNIVQELTGGRVEMKPAEMAGIESGSFRSGRGLLIGLYDPEHMIRLLPNQ